LFVYVLYAFRCGWIFGIYQCSVKLPRTQKALIGNGNVVVYSRRKCGGYWGIRGDIN